MERPGGRRPRSRGDDAGKWLRPIGLLTAIPFILMIGPVLGYFAGNWLDQRLGTEPYLMILLIILGFVSSGRETWKLIQKASRDTE